MPLLNSHPLSTTFAGVNNLETKGMNMNGTTYRSGIADSFDLVNGVAKVTVRDTDVGTYGDRRSEMSFKSQLDPTGERWYTWKFMVPSTWNFNTGMAIMQIHDTPGVGHNPGRAVQFVLLLENGQLVARVPGSIITESSNSYRLVACPFAFDQWHSMCLHANWQSTTTGFWEMYVNRTAMFKQYGIATAYNDAVGGYLKLGIYNFHKAEGWGTKTIYFSDVNIWSGNDGYQAVMGGAPFIGTRLLEP